MHVPGPMQPVIPLMGFPNALFQAQPPRTMNVRTQKAAVGSTHASSPWTPGEDSVLTRLHDPGSNDWDKVVAALRRRTIAAVKARWRLIQQKEIEDG
jgi:hypothetical protein